MGRDSTGAWTVYESNRIELSWLLKVGFIKKGCMKLGTISWTNNHGQDSGMVAFKSEYNCGNSPNSLQLSYVLTDGDGIKTDHDHTVQLFEQPSNLGKGYVLYFICPQTFRKCRILYRAYGSPIFKSRFAYRNRLYYDCQQASKLSKYNDNYWRIDKILEKLEGQACRGQRTFQGNLTKAAERYNRLYSKQCLMEGLRWTLGAPKSIRGFGGYG